MRNASARGRLLKATFNNNLPSQTGDLKVNPINPVNPVNPVNPDSKPDYRTKC